MNSFDTDQSVTNEPTPDQATFKVGDREFNVESASKKITAADAHIATLEAEAAEARQKLAAMEAQVAQSMKLEDALQKLNNASLTEVRASESTTSFDTEKLTEAAKQAALDVLTQREQENHAKSLAELQQKTFAETKKTLSSIYGDNVDKAITEKLGIPVEQALDMAKDPVQSKVLLSALAPGAVSKSSHMSSDVNLGSTNGSQGIFENKSNLTVSDIEAALREAVS